MQPLLPGRMAKLSWWMSRLAPRECDGSHAPRLPPRVHAGRQVMPQSQAEPPSLGRPARPDGI